MYEERIRLIESFIQARSLFQSDEESAVNACKALLEDPKIDVAVKIGDIYSFLVEYYVAKGELELDSNKTDNSAFNIPQPSIGEHQQAYTLMDELKCRDSSINLSHYIKKTTLESIDKALGMSTEDAGISQQRSQGDDEDILEDLQMESP